ncbi:hypothetical protein HRV97_16915 [Sphingomonas sp. HHU CXW]|jgi:hypothetical protein|uniref:Uncharacterized protein n=1 Tax=Sphingomonas hominis TaxID=2741495 RepID=A0ABX2JSN3_9SPHN|nr:hypothetical protein [Sphingomonas hominis]NTS66823.1 hypothetical protein [Sphingomonas hominis]
MMPTDHEIAFLLDLCGRIMFTYALDPDLAGCALGIANSDAHSMIADERPTSTLEADQAACLPLFANILVRLELRFRHDGDATRAAFSLPLAALNGAVPANLLSGGVTAARYSRQHRWHGRTDGSLVAHRALNQTDGKD